MAGLWACNSKESAAPVTAPAAEEVPVVQPDFTGRLYTSGLSPFEVEKLGLEPPVYQLSGRESFFFSGNDSLRAYIGSCLGIGGRIRKNWENFPDQVNGQYTYGRGALEVHELEVLGENGCRLAEEAETAIVPEGAPEVYSGTIKRMVRPAPDIAYDYAFMPDKPWQDENHPVEPGKWVKELPLVSFEAGVTGKLESALRKNEKVKLKAWRQQGYAEQTVLHIDSVLPKKQ